MNAHLLHHLKTETILMARNVSEAHGLAFWQGAGVLAFALVFLFVGLHRFVEFTDLGFSKRKRSILIGFHVVGILLFAVGTIYFGLDMTARHVKETGSVIGAGLVILLPLHIYINLIRRVRYSDAPPGSSQSSPQGHSRSKSKKI